MANAEKPQGLELAQSEGKQYRVRAYTKKTGTAIYRGDVVQFDAEGNVKIAATTGAVLGVALESKAAASTDEILVCDDPDAVFEAMAYGDFQAADQFQNANWKVGTPDSSRSTSGGSVDMSTKNTTATLQLKLLGLVSRGENAYGSWARVFCKLNDHAFNNGVTGV